jgi:hypothetical protein
MFTRIPDPNFSIPWIPDPDQKDSGSWIRIKEFKFLALKTVSTLSEK